MNGYSGYFPPNYVSLLGPLSRNPTGGDAWNALISSGATHAIVHEDAFLDNEAIEISESLRGRGAREIVTVGKERLLQLR